MSATTETKQLTALDHVAISVSNIKDTVAWYTQQFDCTIKYQDETWALLEFANIRVAFVLPEQHPPHVAVLGDPAAYGQPKTHRDGTRSVYLQDPSGNNVEILALK
ncbi:MAG TPA: VOC family protein [Candidatus Dormibacteraeota bacterium]|jgi:catechol 2,3-dioxygenase-like lactoylglutathione lyase family enzyme|nr:VOC family protein [Candidatus Dormibacteraeota bacterium]